MTDDTPDEDDAERILRSQIRRAISLCPKCTGLPPEKRESRIETVLREIHAKRARVLEPLPAAAWTQTETPTQTERSR